MTTGKENRGRWTAMAAFTCVEPRWTTWLKFFWTGLVRLGAVRWKPARWVLVRTLLRDAEALVTVSIIGFARWTILDRLPGQEAGGHGSKPLKYVLFETNFNGDNDQYLEAFSVVVPTAMRRTWRWGRFGAYHVPDVRQVSRFLRYVNDVKLPISAYYSAYPEASARMIRSALALQPLFDRFRTEFAHADDATFRREYGRLLTRAQTLEDPPAESNLKTGKISVLARIQPGRIDGLKRDLESLSNVLEQHLPADPDLTHFARWAVVEELETNTDEMDRDSAYLLFSAWFDGAEDAYVKKLYRSMGGRAGTIWASCGFVDRNDAGEFWEWIREHRVESLQDRSGRHPERWEREATFTAYDGVTVPRIRSALELADRLHGFAAVTQDLDTSAFRQAWKLEFEVPPTPPVPTHVPA